MRLINNDACTCMHACVLMCVSVRGDCCDSVRGMYSAAIMRSVFLGIYDGKVQCYIRGVCIVLIEIISLVPVGDMG
jgi:hypothetical protein